MIWKEGALVLLCVQVAACMEMHLLQFHSSTSDRLKKVARQSFREQWFESILN